jgi:hypothetical protein
LLMDELLLRSLGFTSTYVALCWRRNVNRSSALAWLVMFADRKKLEVAIIQSISISKSIPIIDFTNCI